jgi:hypothetical protein
MPSINDGGVERRVRRGEEWGQLIYNFSENMHSSAINFCAPRAFAAFAGSRCRVPSSALPRAGETPMEGRCGAGQIRHRAPH